MTSHYLQGPYQVQKVLLPRKEPQHWHARQHGEQRQTVCKDVVHIGVVEAIWHRKDEAIRGHYLVSACSQLTGKHLQFPSSVDIIVTLDRVRATQKLGHARPRNVV